MSDVAVAVLDAAIELDDGGAGARVHAEAPDHDQLAADLHDTVGQTLVAIALFARREAEQLSPDSELAERVERLAALADQGRQEIEQVMTALTFAPACRWGLTDALSDLCASVAADSGIDIGLDVSGRSERVDRETERALYRVAHEALMNAWRHAACASITVELRFNSDALVLTVEDDGVGLLRRGPQRRLHLGISSMSRAMADVGGTLDLGCGGEGGVLVQATVARRP